jgi:hypothetical protein
MKKTLLILIFSVFITYGQNPVWKNISDSKLESFPKMERNVMPTKFHLFNLDLQKLKINLEQAPLDTEGVASNLIIEFPNPDGELTTYRVYEAPVMEKGLMDKFPTIKSYSAQGIEDPGAILRFSVTDFGLHVMAVTSSFGTFYIDTYTKDLKNYIVYNRKDVSKVRNFGCFVEDSVQDEFERQSFENNFLTNDGNLRQYRLALSCTIEYSAYHLGLAGTPGTAPLATKKAVVLSAMVVSLTRLNGIYEKEVAVRMNLVANNDLIIFIDSDSYTNSPTMINEIQPIIDDAIGFGNYDMGHGFCTTDSGIAQLQSICSSGKARGITGQLNPVGDPFDVDYVAHEMGHQFGGNHTQNNNCNRSSASYEPGSASTIMGYAGICAPNVQTNSDAYFHAISIQEITSFITSSATCRQLTPVGNTAPVVNAGANYTIPNGTAFKLTGSATDVNGDALTYCWEQFNNQVTTQPPLQNATTGPNFRSVMPTASPVRYFPQFSDVLNGNLAPTWEVVPTVARTMNFALTVRDNRAGGGMSNRGNMVVTTASVGPFRVTSPTLNASWDSGSTQTITWDVAGTTANGINTSTVNILFSSDNGATFTTLVAGTSNDGSEIITVPNVTQPYCRIMIEAVGNIFYAVSPNFSIGYIVTTTTTCRDYTRSFSPAQAMATGWTGYTIPTVTDNFTISDANLTVVCTAARTNQVSFGLVKPGSTVVDFVAFDGPSSGCANNRADLNAVFDDEGVAFDCSATATGASYIPVTSFSGLDGMNSAGVWRFAAKSTNTSNTISSVTLTLCETNTTAVLSSENFGIDGLSIYPNPNNGNFTVQFTSTSNNEVKIGVHDVRGRQVFDKIYQNNGLFNDSLNLNNVQSGVYFITVQDGLKRDVKKIIIE